MGDNDEEFVDLLLSNLHDNSQTLSPESCYALRDQTLLISDQDDIQNQFSYNSETTFAMTVLVSAIILVSYSMFCNSCKQKEGDDKFKALV